MAIIIKILVAVVIIMLPIDVTLVGMEIDFSGLQLSKAFLSDDNDNNNIIIAVITIPIYVTSEVTVTILWQQFLAPIELHWKTRKIIIINNYI